VVVVLPKLMSNTPREDFYEDPALDPAAWNGIYFSKRDPRLLVPKRPLFGLTLGYTFNFGHETYGFPAFLSLTVLPALIVHLHHLRKGRLA